MHAFHVRQHRLVPLSTLLFHAFPSVQHHAVIAPLFAEVIHFVRLHFHAASNHAVLISLHLISLFDS
ncbi:hypothetical protein D8M34_14345, partial [Microbacterium sp. HSID17254]